MDTATAKCRAIEWSVVRPPNPDEFDPSHEFVADDFHAATTEVVDVALDRATSGFVSVRQAELDSDTPEGSDPAAVWRDVRNALETVETDFRTGRATWYHVALPVAEDELRRLWSLEPNATDAFFLNELLLVGEEEWLFYVLPHRTLCSVNAPDDAFVASVEDALADYWACVVPAGTRVAWKSDGREYRVEGVNLCVESGDSGRVGRYDLSDCFRVNADPTALTLSLAWRVEPSPGLVGRLLGSVRSLVSRPPELLQFEDEATLREVEAVLDETLSKFRS